MGGKRNSRHHQGRAPTHPGDEGHLTLRCGEPHGGELLGTSFQLFLYPHSSLGKCILQSPVTGEETEA